MQEWLVERLPQLTAAATGLAGILGIAWKVKFWPRAERFGRWLWDEIRTTIWAKKELIECKRQSAIREGTFAMTETENRILLDRVATLLEFCSASDSDHRTRQLPQTTQPSNDSGNSHAPTGTQPN